MNRLESSMTEARYRALLRPHERTVRQVLLDLEFFLEDVGSMNVYSTSSRLKSLASSIQKAKRLEIGISDLQDLAGIRVVVAIPTEIDVVARFFSRQEVSNEAKVERDYVVRNAGYRARHIVVAYEGHYSRSVHPTRVEVQLQTVFEHAFNFISRVWVYKSEASFSAEWEQRFREVSDKLNEISHTVSSLHTEVVASAAEREDSSPVSPFSYQSMVKAVFGENVTLNDAVDTCRYYVDLGLTTNGLLRRFLTSETIRDLRDRLLSTEAPEAAGVVDLAMGMSMSSFWSFFGTRGSYFDEFLGQLVKSSEPKP